MDTSANALIQLHSELRNSASSMMSLWDECGRMCLTRKVSSLVTAQAKGVTTDNYRPETRLLNSVAVEANEILAAGCMSWIMPSEGRWFVWKPSPQQEGNDAVEEWLQHCTEVAQTILFSSNFYSRTHEVLQDRSTYGTAALWAEAGTRNPLNFRAWDVGTFVVSENEEGYCDMVFRSIERTARQAKAEFETLPPVVQTHLTTNKLEEKTRYLQCVFPRSITEQSAEKGAKGMPFASLYIHEESKTVVKESGFEEIPAFVTRYLKWSESSAYGVSPAMRALAEIRGVNYLELLMATLAEVTVNPRIILPQGFQGVPDLRAGGITFGGATQDMFPKEWGTSGRFDIGVNLLERKEKAVNEAFHRSLFEMFNSRTGDLNIPHVRALEAEKLARFSPAFTALTSEFINPVVERVFMLLFRAGLLPPAPREAYVLDALGRSTILFPKCVQTNRMSLAMQQAKKQGINELLGMLGPLAAQGVPLLDNFDFDRVTRDLSRGEGLPADYLSNEDTVKQLRDGRAQAAQAAEQKQMMMEAVKSKPLVDAAAPMIKERLGAQ
ncbi:Head-to-tail connector protein, podovirus-type [uncultured Caudovirales phage]|uniref:Head-to-tail connector protein, podovirus-type n=1 Tax=uncultured Caudovirales phage TaxID=2100421 RepID=A0A6J5P2L7_9CAUD|nr:Head-to-tail connector protein, podovirus-type [uncultured Caudovirales phage]